MNGYQLYQLYTQAHARRNIGVDDWYSLTMKDMDIWNEVARATLPEEYQND